MPVIHLSSQVLKTLTVEPGKSRTEWCDSDVKGLYVEARATSPGIGTFYLRYKDDGGTTRHLRLGNTDDLSLAQARKLAADKKAEIRHGANPSLARKQEKQIPTLRQFVEEQYLPYNKVRKRSYKTDVQRFNQRLLPLYGHTRLDQIKTQDLVSFMQA